MEQTALAGGRITLAGSAHKMCALEDMVWWSYGGAGLRAGLDDLGGFFQV